MAHDLSIIDRIALRHLARRGRQYHSGMAVFAHDHIGSLVNLQGVYEGPLLEALFDFLPPTSGLAIDAGANIGNHANFFAKRFDRVEAFEPHPRTFQLLSLNAAPNVACHQLALGDEAGTARLHDNPGNAGGASLSGEGEAFDVDVVTLDSLVLAPSFLKIDVEGHEIAVLKGAAETLRKYRPVIVFEQLPAEFDGDETPVIRFLRRLDYDLWWVRPRARLARLWSKPEFLTGSKVPPGHHSMVLALN